MNARKNLRPLRNSRVIKGPSTSLMEALESRRFLTASPAGAPLAAAAATGTVAPSAKRGGGGGVDLLTLMGFNAPGSTWNYNLTASSAGASASGTGASTVTQDSPTSWDWTTDVQTTGPNAQTVNNDLKWEKTPLGVNLDSVGETMPGGSGETITLANPQICGPLLAGTVTSVTPLTIDVTGIPGGLSGTATLTTTLVGGATVKVPAGTFAATEVTVVIAFSANASVDSGNGTVNVNVVGTDTQTFYGVGGVGLVKVISSAAETETVTGQGTTNINTSITSDLTSYNYIPPGISGTVFNDANGDGLKQRREGGLAGINVNIQKLRRGKAWGGPVTATTGTTGVYSVAGLAAGTYQVSQTVPRGYSLTAPSAGAYTIALADGQNSSGNSFGDHPAATPAAARASIVSTPFAVGGNPAAVTAPQTDSSALLFATLHRGGVFAS